MNAKHSSPRHGTCSHFAPLRNFFSTLTGTGRLLAGALLLLLLLLSSGGTARAQPGNNCYTVVCPTNQTKYVCTDQTPLGPYPLEIITNQCPNPTPLSVICNPGPGTLVGPGVYPVHCTVVAGGVVIGGCDFTVTVILDNIPPQITCPANIIDSACPSPVGGCGKIIFYPAPVASDNSGSVTVTCAPPSGSFFPCGLTTVTCTAEDRCQNRTLCTFTVRINQGANPPTITCPPDLTVDTCSNCAPVFYALPAVNNGVLIGCAPASGTCFPLGTSTVTCLATNPCGNSQCSFSVTVRPVPPVTIACPTTPVVLTVPCGTICVPVAYPAPVVTGGVLIGCTPALGTCLPVGNYNVICRATNDCGQIAGCEFPVTVLQGQGNPPGLQCPADLTATTCSNCAVVNYPLPVVNNGVLIGCTPASGTCFPIGTTSVTCTASNACGGAATCKFDIIVRPVPPAVIVCPTNLVVIAPCNSNCVPVFYAAPTVAGGTLVNCLPPSGACLTVGIHIVTCRATNVCGQVAGCEFSIQVLSGGGQPPVIQCPQDITVETCSNCAPVLYPLPVVFNGVLVGCTPPSGACFPVGTTIVTCLATNICNDAALCEFRVVVRQKPAVSIVCPQDIVVETCGTCEVVNYPAPVVANGVLVSCTPPSGTCFPLGVSSVTCRATNDCGTSAVCKFFVTVREVPTVGIVCPSNIVVTTCGQGEIVQYPAPTLTGSFDPATVSVSCTPPSGAFFPLGTTVVTCCVVDRCARTNCCEFTVTVVPGNPCVKPPLNMVLWLPFDEPAGIIAHNIVAGAPNGIHANGPVPLLGQHVLNSLRFDGVNDYVRVPNYAAIQLGTSHFSIDTWALRRDTTGGRRVIVSKMSATAVGIAGYEFYLFNGVMNLTLRTPSGGANFNSGVAVPLDNQWHFLAVTVQRGALNAARFYLDGALVATVSIALPGSVANASSLLVGSRSFPALGDYFQGYLDELEIFRRILTPLEINQLWQANRAGKCKIKVAIPWDVPFPAGSNYVTVLARIGNCTAIPQTILWNAAGPMPIPVPNGSLVLPPFTFTNVPIQLCRPTNNVPVGAVVRWTLAVSAGTQCPQVSTGSVINPGPAIVVVPTGPIAIPGTNWTRNVRIGLNGLPPGQPIRLRVIGPDMEPDQIAVSLNGLPPGVPWIIGGGGFLPAADGIEVPVKFVDADPIGLYTILLEADLDGDGDFDTLASFDMENPVVPPPSLTIQKSGHANVKLDWQDEGDGLGTLESTDDVVNGPWTPVPGGTPGMTFPPNSRHQFFRVTMPLD